MEASVRSSRFPRTSESYQRSTCCQRPPLCYNPITTPAALRFHPRKEQTMRTILRRSAPLFVVAAVLGSVFAAAPAVKPKVDGKPTYFEGKVVPLADVVAKSGTKLDADAAPFWLALVADD